MLEVVAEVTDLAAARVLIAALRAHGFHPVEGGDGGLPGLPEMFGGKGIPVRVPEDEAADARVLAADLLREMQDR